ncbi:MAG TPA: DEAD/DEAH box helicase, partial [Candidatus Saccharimonadales bacterium]|nr:DEAD/DEAH box helicase [Candidatus Saccharimonadales bacterium]
GEEEGKDIHPAVTASTGIAATHIGGLTIHSWCGIGIKDTLTSRDLSDIVSNKRIVGRIKKAEVLIIDEISMLSAKTFTAVDKVCRAVRKSNVPFAEDKSKLPFGGLQVVLVGDFFQLPPVTRRVEVSNEQTFFPDEDENTTPFAFSSPAWRELDPTVCYLIEQHRQEDAVLLNALNAIRSNVVDDITRDCLAGRIVSVLPKETITKLFPHNANVDRINEVELAKLTTQKRSFAMHSRGAPPLIESLIRNCLSPESLVLKVGAKVMFTKNHPEGRYVNGTLGEVIGFDKEEGQPIVKTRAGKTIVVEVSEWGIQDGEKILAAIDQYPLRLAWAITVHKSQGMSLDAAVIDLRQAFEYGQGYVALSRVRTLDGLYLLGFNARALEVHPTVSEQDARFREASALACRQLTRSSS